MKAFAFGSSCRDIHAKATARLTAYSETVNNVLALRHPLNLLKQ